MLRSVGPFPASGNRDCSPVIEASSRWTRAVQVSPGRAAASPPESGPWSAAGEHHPPPAQGPGRHGAGRSSWRPGRSRGRFSAATGMLPLAVGASPVVFVAMALQVLFGGCDVTVPAAQGLGLVPAFQRAALVDLYNSTDGTGWADSVGWLEGDPCTPGHQWSGVSCGDLNDVTYVPLDPAPWRPPAVFIGTTVHCL